MQQDKSMTLNQLGLLNKLKLLLQTFYNPDKTTKDVIIACYGLAFKPDIDDLRESPACELQNSLQTALW